MVHSVELLFDTETEAAIREIWTDLADSGIGGLAGQSSPSNRPHITLTVAEDIAEGIGEGLDQSLRTVLERLPLACVIGGPTLFGGGRAVTLVRTVVPSARLLDLHAEVHRIAGPHMPKGPLPHAAPGHWTPHVTLARRVAPEQLGTAVTRRGLFREIRATAVGLRHWDGKRRVEHPIS